MFFAKSELSSGRLLFVVETGNTTTSLVIFKGTEILEAFVVSTKSLSNHHACRSTFEPILMRYPELCDAAICSVVPLVEQITGDYLRCHLTGKILTVSASLILPFELHYISPGSFGADRLALCAMSQSLYPEESVIALDIGTAITFDVLSSTRHYLGGLIMPGLDLMAKALHEYTARLPLADLDRPKTLLGCSTVDGIRNGIIHGTASSLDGLLEKIKRWLHEMHHENHIKVLATGGNAHFLASVLSSAIVVEELAVVKGTRYLFSLNA